MSGSGSKGERSPVRPGSRPRVSVVLPVRNASATVAAALESVTSQTLEEIEIVVVDDRSTDGSSELLDRLAREDTRVRVITSPSPGGIVAALNAGLRAARAPLVARMDADDLCSPRRLEVQERWMVGHAYLGAVGCLVEIFSEGRLGGGMEIYQEWLNCSKTPTELEREIFVESPLCHPSVMFRADSVAEVGEYRSFDGPEDYDLWLRLRAAGWGLAKVPEVLFRWRDRPDRLTRTDPRYRREAFERLKLDHLLPLLPKSRRIGIWGAGSSGKRWARLLSSAGVEVEFHIDVDPRKIGGTVRGAPVLGVDQLPDPRGSYLLVAVGAPGARELIRGHLSSHGWWELRDHRCLL